MPNPLVSKNIIKYSLEKGKIEEQDFLAVEKEIFIYLNNKTYSFSGTPTHIKELVLGFLISKNLIENSTLLKKLEYKETSDKILTKVELIKVDQILNEDTSKKKEFNIRSKKLLELFKNFLQTSELFKITGCTHSAALADNEKIWVLVEDIRRHNVMNKILGWAYLNKILLSNKMLFISSRVSSEMIEIAVKKGIPLVASRGAPTSLAVKLAEENGLTLIGFLRENRFNLYTHPKRVIF